jgi:probable phosphoglycerate mutase
MIENSPRCLLVRHAETEWSRSGRHSGRTDLDLLPEGEAQARALAPRMVAFRTATIFTSPLRRARHTCDLIGLGRDAVVDPDLSEWDYGSYDGYTTAEIRDEWPAWNLFADGTPDGERAAEVGRRVDRVIARIRAAPGDVVCVAHAHVLRVLGARWIGLEPAGARHFRLAPCSVSELGWERDEAVIVMWNSDWGRVTAPSPTGVGAQPAF